MNCNCSSLPQPRLLAWHYVKYSVDVRLAALQNEARDQNVGLWQDAHRVAPWGFRNDVRIETALPVNVESTRDSDDVVYVTKAGSKYHQKSCRYAENATPIPISRAVSAYEPCGICKPDN